MTAVFLLLLAFVMLFLPVVRTDYFPGMRVDVLPV